MTDYNLSDLSPILPDIDKLAEKLNYFYFIPMAGGIANDGDMFVAELKYRDRLDLLDKLKKVGIVLKVLELDNNSRPIAGRSIDEFPDLEDPHEQVIEDVKCVVSVYKKRITFIICGTGTNNPYSFTRADFNACLKLEAIFDRCGFSDDRDFTIEINQRARPRRSSKLAATEEKPKNFISRFWSFLSK